MPWGNGGPGSKIPKTVKDEVRDRQHNLCNTISARVCTGLIEQFDHVINVASQGIDRAHANDPAGIQGLCIPCHKVKTQAEAQAGKRRRRQRPAEIHPGLRR